MNLSTNYSKYKNQTLHWLPMDTEERYHTNLRVRYNELKKFGWIDCNFSYEFNSHGFRCKEFTDDPTILFLGCSHTVGIGLPLETIWPEIVSRQLKMNCANLGIGGASADTSFRLCHGYIDQIKPKIVVFLPPPSMRIEIFREHLPMNITANSNSKFYQEWISGEENDFYNYQKNVLAMKKICYDRNIKFVECNLGDYENSVVDLARDLAHWGVNTHKIIAADVINKINS